MEKKRWLALFVESGYRSRDCGVDREDRGKTTNVEYFADRITQHGQRQPTTTGPVALGRHQQCSQTCTADVIQCRAIYDDSTTLVQCRQQPGFELATAQAVQPAYRFQNEGITL